MSDVDDNRDNRDNHDHHVPSAAFRASLDREIARAYRAEARFGSTRGSRNHRLGIMIGLTMGAVVTLTIGLVLGASTGYASAEVVTERQREVTATALETARRFDAFRLRLAETNYQRTQSDFAKGVATPEALHAAKTELDTMRASVSRAELDLRDTHDNASLPRPAFAILRGFVVRNGVQNCAPIASAAQVKSTSAAQQSVPIVELPAATAKTTDKFGAVLDVRGLPGGGILVDDPVRRQVKALDSTLGPGVAVIDSAPGANSYGALVMPLVGYVGDSTLFPSIRNLSMVMLDPRGAIARTVAMPARDVGLIRKGGTDNTGRLVFLGEPAITSDRKPGIPPQVADSTPLLRADFALRRTDTIAYVRRPLRRADVLQTFNGAKVGYWTPNPLATIDEWAVITDGSIALVRGHDYHIDWIRPDGSKSSTAKLPFDWRQLTEADKEKMLDSAEVLWTIGARNNTLVNGVDKVTPWTKPPGGWTMPTAADTMGLLHSKNNGGRDVSILPPPRGTVDQVFDYYPPIRSGSVLADMDDHLWILPTTSKQSKAGELVYDVVNTKGELFERVRVPLGRYIVGFGHGGVVYLATGNLTTGFTIERTTLPNDGPRR